ncbi:hypothetical protein BDB01DRAFT_721760 [Pilobolus umbonatus]|nr:hypothetical protein BDB01DRAFT_721760 [Pilobolus umbonatus]
MSTLQPEVPTKAIRALRLRLQTVKKYLEPLLSKPLTETYTKLPLAERCEFEILLSYALNTLYYIYLRTQGSDPQSHDVMTELARIQDYIMKIKVLRGEGPKRKNQLLYMRLCLLMIIDSHTQGRQ